MLACGGGVCVCGGGGGDGTGVQRPIFSNVNNLIKEFTKFKFSGNPL